MDLKATMSAYQLVINILDLIDMGDSDVIIAGLRKEKGYTQSQLKNPISYSELYSPNQ